MAKDNAAIIALQELGDDVEQLSSGLAGKAEHRGTVPVSYAHLGDEVLDCGEGNCTSDGDASSSDILSGTANTFECTNLTVAEEEEAFYAFEGDSDSSWVPSWNSPGSSEGESEEQSGLLSEGTDPRFYCLTHRTGTGRRWGLRLGKGRDATSLP